MPGTEFTYVYLLVTQDGHSHYVVTTIDLKDRIRRHNQGQVAHTAKLRPWRIKSAIAFDSEEKAAKFERYLKSHSGREWDKRHL